MTSISKSYNECYNTYHSTIRMKFVNVKSNISLSFNVKKNISRYPKFEFGDHAKISKYKDIIFSKAYTLN